MSRKTSKRKPNNHLTRAKRIVKGLIVTWQNKTPLASSTAIQLDTVSHRNALSRSSASIMFKKYKDWICFKQPFHWEITITCIFDHAKNEEQHEARILTALGTIDQIATACEYTVKEMFAAERAEHGNMDRYKTTQFSCECLGYN